jgi:hypothetical protein
VTEKSSEAGDDLEDAAVPLVWGVVDMQGTVQFSTAL